jgi:hypothetical protein
MVLKLYGQPYATCAKRVLTILKETNTPFEFIGVKSEFLLLADVIVNIILLICRAQTTR